MLRLTLLSILFASFGHALSLATFQALLPDHLPSFIAYTLPPSQPPAYLSSFIDVDTYASAVYAIQSRWPDNFGHPPSSRLSTSAGVALVLQDPSTGHLASWSQIDLTAAKVMVLYEGKFWDTTALAEDTASMPFKTPPEATVSADHVGQSGLRWRRKADDFLDAVSDLITGDRISVSLDCALCLLATVFGLVSIAKHCLRIHDSSDEEASLFSSRVAHMKALFNEFFRLVTRPRPHDLLVLSTTTIPSNMTDDRGDPGAKTKLKNDRYADEQAPPTKSPSDAIKDGVEASRSEDEVPGRPSLDTEVKEKDQKKRPLSDSQTPPSTSMPTGTFTFTTLGPSSLQKDAPTAVQKSIQKEPDQIGPFTINADGKVVAATSFSTDTSSTSVSCGSAPAIPALKGRKSTRSTPSSSSSHSARHPAPPVSNGPAYNPTPMAHKKPDGHRPYHGNPFSGNPFSGDPFSGNPFSGDPFSGNPFATFSPSDEGQYASSSSHTTGGPSSGPFDLASAPRPFAPAVAQASGSQSVLSGSHSRTRKAAAKKANAEQIEEGASKASVQYAAKVPPEGEKALANGDAVAGPSKSPAAGQLNAYDQTNIKYHSFTTEFAGRTAQAIGDIGGKPVIAAEETMDGLIPPSTDFYTPPAPVDPSAPRGREMAIDPFAGMFRGALKDEEMYDEPAEAGEKKGGAKEGPTKREKAQASSFAENLSRAAMITTGQAPDVILPSQKETRALRGKEEGGEKGKGAGKTSAVGKVEKSKEKEAVVTPVVPPIVPSIAPPVVGVAALELWVAERVNLLDDLIASWLPTHRHVYNHLKPGLTLPDEALELYQEIISRLEEIDYRWESEFGREGEIRFKYWLRRVGEQ